MNSSHFNQTTYPFNDAVFSSTLLPFGIHESLDLDPIWNRPSLPHQTFKMTNDIYIENHSFGLGDLNDNGATFCSEE
ncbi:hypothetical protein M3J09_012008 [Ascochyta lentis]